VAILIYVALFQVVHLVATRVSAQYRTRDSKGQTEYCQYVSCFCHSNIAVLMALVSMFGVCGRTPTGDLITVFNDNECFDTPRNFHLWTLFNTCGFFLVDFFITAFVIARHSFLDRQMYAHHLVSTISFYLTLCLMNWSVVAGCMFLFTEISSAYLRIRWLLTTHSMGNSLLAKLNGIWIAISFFGGRLIF